MRALLTIPGEPVAKGRPRAALVAGRARIYTPKKTADEEARIADLASRQWDGPPWSCPVQLIVMAYFPVRASWSKRKQASAIGQPHVQTPDGDNIVKLISDALNGVAYIDDAQVYDVRCSKWWAPLPRVEVVLIGFGDNGGRLL